MSAYFAVQSAQQQKGRQHTVNILYRICEKSIAQKLLNAAMLFKDHVFTKTAAMSEVGDIFAADIQYHDHSCKSYAIEEIMANLEMEDLVYISYK